MSREVREDFRRNIKGGACTGDWWYSTHGFWSHPNTLSLCGSEMAQLFDIPADCDSITVVVSEEPHPQAYPLRLVEDEPVLMGVTVLLAFKKQQTMYVSQDDRASFMTKNREPGGGWWHPIICLSTQKKYLLDLVSLREVVYLRVEIDE